MSFFEYFEVAYLLVTTLGTIAAFTPTQKDDHVLSRIKNLMDKARFLFKKNP